MPLLARAVFALVNFVARKGLRDPETSESQKLRARQTGVRGETFAYWFLRRQGYVLIARNYTSPELKGEIDLVGFDGNVLAFVEVKTRTVGPEQVALPEEAVTRDKRRHLVRMARQFLLERKLISVPHRFDILAIENRPGQRPAVRLHKDAFPAAGS